MTLHIIWLLFSIPLVLVSSEDVTLDKTNTTEVINKLCRIIENNVGESSNDVVDFALEQIKYEIVRLGKDAIDLPDVVNKFEWKTSLIYSADNFSDHFNAEELSFKNGMLLDLSDFERYKSTKLTEQGEDITVDTSFRYPILVFDYQYNAKFIELGPEEYLRGLISNTTFTVQLSFSSDGLVTLQNIKLDELGRLAIVWNAKSATDSVYQSFSKVTEPFLKSILTSTLSKYVNETLQELIIEYNSEISY